MAAATLAKFSGARLVAPTRPLATRRSLVLVRAKGTDSDTPNPKADPTKPNTNKQFGVDEALTFDGPAPETINGRLAMVGFVAAVGAEIFTGKPLLQQFGEAGGIVTAVAALFIVASLIPIVRGANLKGSGPGGNGSGVPKLTKKAELWNGRAAMVGVAALIIVESIKGGALFG